MSIRVWMTERRRHYDGYRRPSRAVLIVMLSLFLLGSLWIDFEEVPFGLRSLACDFHVTPWSGILTSPKFFFALPILLAELVVWAWIMVWMWPVRAISQPVASDWILLALVFLIAGALYIFQVAALQPAPWHQCLTDIHGT